MPTLGDDGAVVDVAAGGTFVGGVLVVQELTAIVARLSANAWIVFNSDSYLPVSRWEHRWRVTSEPRYILFWTRIIRVGQSCLLPFSPFFVE
jgi:hypothetical protein